MPQNASVPSIDDIVLIVKNKAIELEKEEKQVETVIDRQLISGDNECLPDWILGKKSYHMGELLLFDGNKSLYIKVLFQVLLKREADDEALNYYSKKLNSKQLSPAMFFLMIYLSPEGRSNNLFLKGGKGMGRLFHLHSSIQSSRFHRISYFVPFFVRLLEVVINIYGNQIKKQYIRRNGFNYLHQTVLRENNLLHNQKKAVYSIRDELLSSLEKQKDKLNLIRNDDCYQQNYIKRMIELLDTPKSLSESDTQKLFKNYKKTYLDAYYVAFEDENRGSLEEISEKLSVYLPLIKQYKKESKLFPILDIGCGRGEWLKLLADESFSAKGVDMNPAMLDVAKEQGLNVSESDGVAYLADMDEGSLSVITAFHIIEHLPFEAMFALFAEAYRALIPGGCIIFETPNPENILVGSHTFYHDFTHRNPITPTSIDFLARYHNFVDIQIKRLNPYPESAKVSGGGDLTDRVNGHFCGPQDFAIIAFKPALKDSVAEKITKD